MALQRLRAATRSVVEPAIEQLRSRPRATEQPPLDPERYQQMCTLLIEASHPREEIESTLNTDTKTLVRAILELARFMLATKGNPLVRRKGTWSQVHGSSDALLLPGMANPFPAVASKKRIAIPEPVVIELVVTTPDQPGLVGVDGKPLVENPSAGTTKVRRKKVRPAGPPITEIVVPDGFSREEIGKDIDGSLNAIIALHPTADDVTRFIQRHYSRPSAPLSFEMLSAVWTFARLDRLGGLAKVCSESDFLDNVVKAYDTLETARRDAMEALAVLCTSDDSAELRAAATRLAPLWEAEATNILGLIDGGDAAVRSLRRAQDWLARRAGANQLVVESVKDLSQGQVRRIAMLAGFDTEVVSRNEETYIRTRLAEMNLALDAEQLVPIGVAAIRAGHEVAFFDACAKRAEGDQDWAEDLGELMLQRA